jgi:hypothetical protein
MIFRLSTIEYGQWTLKTQLIQGCHPARRVCGRVPEDVRAVRNRRAHLRHQAVIYTPVKVAFTTPSVVHRRAPSPPCGTKPFGPQRVWQL